MKPVVMFFRIALLFGPAVLLAQSNFVATDEVPQTNSGSTNRGVTWALRFEKSRRDCIQARRIICGKVIRVLPDGFLIDSGYTNLMRPPLDKSWLIPGTVVAVRPADLIEANEPDAVCTGSVFLADLPKSHGKPKKPRLYDYVNLEAFPIGMYTYNSVGTVHHTVRRFTTKLSNATQWNFQHAQTNAPAN